MNLYNILFIILSVIVFTIVVFRNFLELSIILGFIGSKNVIILNIFSTNPQGLVSRELRMVIAGNGTSL